MPFNGTGGVAEWQLANEGKPDFRNIPIIGPFLISLLMEPAEWQSGSWHLRENLISEIKKLFIEKTKNASRQASHSASQSNL